MKTQHTDQWLATITVQLIPVNRYGDQTGKDGMINYAINMSGPLSDVVMRLEMLRDPEMPS